MALLVEVNKLSYLILSYTFEFINKSFEVCCPLFFANFSHSPNSVLFVNTPIKIKRNAIYDHVLCKILLLIKDNNSLS